MIRLKSIKLYFFSILRLFFLSFRNYYFKSKFYNKKLITFEAHRLFYSPSSYLSASLTSAQSDFYDISNTSSDLLWNEDIKNKFHFSNLHSFLWLTKINRKNNKLTIQTIINSWIKKYYNYEPNAWEMETISKRIIAWVSNTDLTLEDSDKIYRQRFFKSIIKQSNFLLFNLKNLSNSPEKIICCSAIILSGIIFKENSLNFKIGIKELEKIIKNFFDSDGFPKTRNPEEVYISIKYLILVREWLKESQNFVPDFLDEIIKKCGNCYSILSCSNNQFPLFNGATEIDNKDYYTFLKNLKYKFNNKSHEVAGLIKIKNKKLEFFIDLGNPPPDNFTRNYQAGCLAFELISNKQKVICNLGYAKYFSPKLSSISKSTAAHSTLYLNDTSSCKFLKNKLINKVYGNCLMEKHKVIDKTYKEDKDFFFLSASHNGYEKSLGYIHTRSIKVAKNKDLIFGIDTLKKTKRNINSVIYSVRFHIYPNIKITKTKGGKSILISLSNGDGWLLQSATNEFEIEKNIFFGDKRKIINNESIFISKNISQVETSIQWIIEKIS